MEIDWTHAERRLEAKNGHQGKWRKLATGRKTKTDDAGLG